MAVLISIQQQGCHGYYTKSSKSAFTPKTVYTVCPRPSDLPKYTEASVRPRPSYRPKYTEASVPGLVGESRRTVRVRVLPMLAVCAPYVFLTPSIFKSVWHRRNNQSYL
jgi:hypothetical protein